MAFETVQITSKRNGAIPVNGYREDLASGETISLSLTDTTGIVTFRWELVGRPEGSIAGGAGPEPILLGTSATASFVVDADGAFTTDGTYVVVCTLNDGSASRKRISTELVRLSGLTLADGRTLRIPGGFETFEDTSQALVRQGWATAAARWLRKVREIGNSVGGPEPTLYYAKAAAALGNNNLIVFWEDFLGGAAEWNREIVGGSIALRNDVSGGQVLVISGAAGQRTKLARGNASNGNPALVNAVSTQKWYIASRMRFSSNAFTSNDYAGISLFDSGGTVKAVIGTHGAVGGSPGVKLWSTGGAPLLDAADGTSNIHIVEAWSDGTGTFLRSTNDVTGGVVNASNGSSIAAGALCGAALDVNTPTAGAARSLWCDWIFVAIPTTNRDFT